MLKRNPYGGLKATRLKLNGAGAKEVLKDLREEDPDTEYPDGPTGKNREVDERGPSTMRT